MAVFLPLHLLLLLAGDVETNPGPITDRYLASRVFRRYSVRLAHALGGTADELSTQFLEAGLISREKCEQVQLPHQISIQKGNLLLAAISAKFDIDEGDQTLRKLCKIMSKHEHLKKLSKRIMIKYEEILTGGNEGSLSSDSDDEHDLSETSTPSSAKSPQVPVSSPQTVQEGHLVPSPSTTVPPPVTLATPCLVPAPTATVFPPVPTSPLDALPDGPLEAIHLRLVLRYLEKQCLVSRWRRIGLELELTIDKLDTIQRNRDSVEDRIADMLDQWLSSGRATKQALVEAVREVKI